MKPLNNRVDGEVLRICANTHGWSPLPFNGEGLFPRDKALRVERIAVLLGLKGDIT